MIIVSIRDKFDDPSEISTSGHSAKEINLSTDTEKPFEIKNFSLQSDESDRLQGE